MKKYLFVLLIAVAGLASCGKNDDSNTVIVDPATQAKTDDAKIQAYIKANNITATKDSASGLYYQVIKPGTGSYPKISSTVNVAYKGTLLDGSVFDSNANTSFQLSGVIKGWQIGIPHINMGGRILLICPSALAYGSQSSDKFPAYSVMVFTVDLLGFQ